MFRQTGCNLDRHLRREYPGSAIIDAGVWGRRAKLCAILRTRDVLPNVLPFGFASRQLPQHVSLLDNMYNVMYIFRMPKSYSIAAARAQLAELVDQAESGKDVELTRRGKKVAVLLSAAKYARLSGNRVAFMSAFDNFCRENDMREIGVEPGWAEKLRDKSPGRSVKL